MYDIQYDGKLVIDHLVVVATYTHSFVVRGHVLKPQNALFFYS